MRSFMIQVTAVAVLAAPAFAVDFYNIATIDTQALGAPRPGSVSMDNGRLYVGALFGSAQVSEINNPLGAAALGNQFGGPAGGNGFVSLDVHGNTIVAASNNGGANDVIQTFDLNGNLIASSTAAGIGRPRIDGAAVDPGWVNGGGGGSGVATSYFGGGRRYLYDNNLNFDNDSAITFTGGWGTGFRDIHFDAATGDMYARGVNGIIRGKRVGDNNFAQLDGVSAGFQAILGGDGSPFADGFSSAINTAFLPDFDGSGTNTVIANFRGFGTDFATRILVADADGVDSLVAPNWRNADGSGAFADLNTPNGDGIYDFDYDSSTGILAVSDWANEKVYLFSGTAIPEPASLLLLTVGGLFVVRRR